MEHDDHEQRRSDASRDPGAPETTPTPADTGTGAGDSHPDAPVEVDDVAAHARRRGRRARIRGTVVALVAVALVVVAFVVPMPFVVDGPGPTVDVTGRYGDTPVISVSGTDPSTGEPVEVDAVREAGSDTGELRMVTVSESGGPGNRLNFVQLVGAWLDSRDTIIPYKEAYPDDVTQEEVDEAQSAQMTSSQSTAEVAALEELGWTVPATVTIEGAVSGSGAEGVVEQGDVLRTITTPDKTVHQVDSASVPFTVMQSVAAGSTLILGVTRDGVDQDLTVVSTASTDGSEGSKLGIYLTADVDLPLDITISLENIGGPSAGMMFALGIIDRLTPGDMTGGNTIAGTGTMSYDGQVGAIGGIRQKMWGAQRDGATWFLAPASNCDEVVGHEPSGLTVVAVSTLEEARSAVEKIADGQGDTLQTCEAEQAQSGQSGD